MAKKMTLNNLKTLENKTFTTKKVLIDVEGQDFEVVVQEIFKPKSVEMATSDLRNMIDQCESLNMEINVATLSLLVILKHFTDIKFTNDLVKDLQMFVIMSNLEIVDTIFEEFKEQELDKLNQYIQKTLENLPKLIDLVKSETEKLTKAVESNA